MVWRRSPPIRPPRLVRVTRALKRASLILFVVFILYLATIAYSFGTVAKDLHPNGGSTPATFVLVGASTILGSQSLNVSNPGLYSLALDGGVVVYTSAGSVIGHGTTPSGRIAAGASGMLAFDVLVSVAPRTPGQALLTNSATLEFGIWVNVTVGLVLVVPVSAHLVQNESWGAPFLGAVVSANVVGSHANLTLAFRNDASFSLAGSLAFQLLTPGGASCGAGAFGVSTPSGQPFDQTTEVSSSCANLTGDSFVATLGGGFGSPFSVQLPAIPVGA